MPRVNVTASIAQVRAAVAVFAAEAGVRSRDMAARVARPKGLEAVSLGATRTGQFMAAMFLGPLIVVSLALIVVFNNLMSDVFVGNDPVDTQHSGMVAFVMTAITLGAFIAAAWAWFQWVRTAGFGFFSWEG